MVWTFCRREKYLVPTEIRNPDHPARSLAANRLPQPDCQTKTLDTLISYIFRGITVVNVNMISVLKNTDQAAKADTVTTCIVLQCCFRFWKPI